MKEEIEHQRHWNHITLPIVLIAFIYKNGKNGGTIIPR